MKTKRNGPANNGAVPRDLNTSDTEFTCLLGLQRHEPLTPEDRADLDLIIAAAERGFRLATRCTACGSWISNPKSVRAHMGPVCRSRSVAE